MPLKKCNSVDKRRFVLGGSMRGMGFEVEIQAINDSIQGRLLDGGNLVGGALRVSL